MVEWKKGSGQRAAFVLKLSFRVWTTVSCLGLAAWPAWALPGQPVSVAETWILTNPTLSPNPNERLTINRVAAPGQRFTFQASVFPVTGVQPGGNQRLIRTERFTLVDHANDITPERLKESLRAIYGLSVFNDYRQATLLFSYTNPQAVSPSDPGLRLQGQVREGQQFAYWQELAYDQTGNVYLGRMAVFLKEDLPLLRQQLAN